MYVNNAFGITKSNDSNNMEMKVIMIFNTSWNFRKMFKLGPVIDIVKYRDWCHISFGYLYGGLFYWQVCTNFKMFTSQKQQMLSSTWNLNTVIKSVDVDDSYEFALSNSIGVNFYQPIDFQDVYQKSLKVTPKRWEKKSDFNQFLLLIQVSIQ